ncbi:hypothetical protein ONZ45_g19359 [Pleurotus djamor]|nr:hypothetical protein ONZ45_g19359 [Pleurotus djamor]
MVPRSASLSGVASTRLGSRSIPGARPLVDVPVPQRASDFAIPPGASRPGRILKSSSAKYVSSNGFDRISESEGADSDLDHEPSPIYTQDTDLIDGERYGHSSSANPLSQRQRSHGAIGTSSTLEKSGNRPRTSLGLNHQNASSRTDVRRVTDEREREDYPKYYRDDRMAGRHTPDGIYEGDVQHQADGLPSQHRPTYTHRRRDSDTLRSTAYSCNSPTAVEIPRPSAADPKRLSPVSRSSSSAMHRRSPTAPELPTNNGTIAPPNASAPASKTWAPGEGKDSERGRDHAAPLKNPSKQVPLRPPPAVPTGQIQSAAGSNGRQFTVNRKTYARLDMIGKGGTSRVYRVLNSANEVYALKRVSLDRTDPESLSGYTNEIALLKRLDGNSRIIRLIDSELKAGPGGSKGCLMMVMECGEIDLARLLHEQQKEPFNILWVAFYWQQMLQAVHVIHEEKIVHSDLKPANFVLVKGQLKLIDFGIANAIANDTTNIQRDAQIGTVNYMSPEAIELPDGMRRLKVGRPSDIWSLGCILYQMVYGRPPFHNLNMYQKMKAIPSTSHIIDFPEDYTPSLPTPSRSPGSSTPPKPLEHLTRPVRKEVINCMKSCLVRNPKERATIPQLLAEEWLAMERNEPPPPEPKPVLKPDETIINPHYMRQLLQYGIKLGQSGGAEMDAATLLRDAEVVFSP